MTPSFGAVRRRTAALAELKRASELAPDNARYAYVHAIALNSGGARAEAMRLLEQNQQRHPTDRESLLEQIAVGPEGPET
jgi:predicted Zn-dependent protease